MQAPSTADTPTALKIDLAYHPIIEVGGGFCFFASRAPARARWRRKRKVRKAPVLLLGTV